MKRTYFYLVLLAMSHTSCTNREPSIDATVHIVGTMRNVMHKGELFATIHIDTIGNKTHLYGIGPLEYMRGEILISDGTCYVSKVSSDNSIAVNVDEQVTAPFFVYANVNKWKEVTLPDSISSIKQLEAFLVGATKRDSQPFAFRVSGIVETAIIHIVNLPEGTAVHSSDDAHKGEVQYTIENKDVELIGFFSTEHAGVFTHHDTSVHIHLITDDKKRMGHLDELNLVNGKARLFLPDTN